MLDYYTQRGISWAQVPVLKNQYSLQLDDTAACIIYYRLIFNYITMLCPFSLFVYRG